ncbi:Protein of unknown function [Pyronema omphalodes CBS 100304]|uniref:Uncharacterized protein n=1 Tax=Pyronema omphalodes (strain CBS 100304) TaxID=1076935 RepID=U4LJ75_PYROM|nr:Protein of unknown function [Pyronema omphalodes CBS 100304]
MLNRLPTEILLNIGDLLLNETTSTLHENLSTLRLPEREKCVQPPPPLPESTALIRSRLF